MSLMVCNEYKKKKKGYSVSNNKGIVQWTRAHVDIIKSISLQIQ